MTNSTKRLGKWYVLISHIIDSEWCGCAAFPLCMDAPLCFVFGPQWVRNPGWHLDCVCFVVWPLANDKIWSLGYSLFIFLKWNPGNSGKRIRTESMSVDEEAVLDLIKVYSGDKWSYCQTKVLLVKLRLLKNFGVLQWFRHKFEK